MNKQNNSFRVLYAGDTSLSTAAAYLAGVMSHYGIDFDYVDSSTAIAQTLNSGDYQAFVISDYPGSNFTDEDFSVLIEKVSAGAGLMMIGGWESYCGQNGEYNSSPLADLLPVTMAESDDRINFDKPCVLEKVADHEITAGLPFDCPPTVGGRNNITPKSGAKVLLNARRIEVARKADGEYELNAAGTEPMLIISGYGAGRVAAYAGDVAPHWVGGLVDWGEKRVKAQAEGAGDVEVGNYYADFFARLVKWTAGINF